MMCTTGGVLNPGGRRRMKRSMMKPSAFWITCSYLGSHGVRWRQASGQAGVGVQRVAARAWRPHVQPHVQPPVHAVHALHVRKGDQCHKAADRSDTRRARAHVLLSAEGTKSTGGTP